MMRLVLRLVLVKRSAETERKETLLTSTGNFARHEAVDFLRGFSDVLQPSDTLLIGVDSCNDPSKI